MTVSPYDGLDDVFVRIHISIIKWQAWLPVHNLLLNHEMIIDVRLVVIYSRQETDRSGENIATNGRVERIPDQNLSSV